MPYTRNEFVSGRSSCTSGLPGPERLLSLPPSSCPCSLGNSLRSSLRRACCWPVVSVVLGLMLPKGLRRAFEGAGTKGFRRNSVGFGPLPATNGMPGARRSSEQAGLDRHEYLFQTRRSDLDLAIGDFAVSSHSGRRPWSKPWAFPGFHPDRHSQPHLPGGASNSQFSRSAPTGRGGKLLHVGPRTNL